VRTVDGALQQYDVNDASRPVESFIEDLSTWYVRRSRRRFWKSASDADKESAYRTLHHALVTLSSLMAPFTPFLADAIYRNLTGDESVHLADFPVADPSAIDAELEVEMQRARRAVELGLAARDLARVKVRQPLRSASLPGDTLHPEIAAIVQDELNVKSLRFGSDTVQLDLELTDELRLEGLARELVRRIQDLRKRSGFNIEDRIVTHYEGDPKLEQALQRFADYVQAETLSVRLLRERPDGVEGASFSIDGDRIWLALSPNR
jgi:isoleucyl-tRNA synthetase